MLTMVVDVRSRCSFLIIITFVFIGFVPSIQQTSKIYNVESISAEHKQLIYQSWSHLDDVLALRKFEDVGIETTRMPIGFQKELTKMLTFPTGLRTGSNFTSNQCVEDTLFYINHLLIKGSDWAIQMMGTSGQLPGSISGSGNRHAEGLFDECQAIRSVPSRFKGQYCTVFFNIEELDELDYAADSDSENEDQNNPSVLFLLRRLFGPSVDFSRRVKPRIGSSNMKAAIHHYPSLGVCLPSSCSASDLGHAVAQLVGSYVISGNQSIVTIADENLCFTNDRVLPPMDGPSITVTIICSFIVLLVLLASVHETWRNYSGICFDKEKDSTIVTALHCFSAISNSQKLLSFKSAVEGRDNLSCLSGIRVMAATCVIIFHSCLKISCIGSNYLLNPSTYERLFGNLMRLTSSDTTFGVDTFFVMSAILVTYNILNSLDYTSGKLNFISLFIQRYFRMTVVYALVFAVVSTVWIYFDQGPNWYYLFMMTEKCRVNWWKHLFYINNFYLYDMDECFLDSWFMAVDMQLFLFAPFLVYLLWRWKKVGLVALATLTLGSLITLALLLYFYNLPENLVGFISISDWKKESSVDYLNLVYSKTWTRAPSYMIGILTGWILHITKKTKLILSPKNVSILWMVYIGLNCYILFGTQFNIYFEQSFPVIDKVVRLIYGTLHRSVWSLSVSLAVVACVHGYGGFLNRFLSWEGFLPLGRLTYCVYLLEWNFFTAYYASQRKRFHYTLFTFVIMTGGFLVVIYGLAFF